MKRLAAQANLAREDENSDECDDALCVDIGEPSTSSAAKKARPKQQRNVHKWKALLKKSKIRLECRWKDCTFTNEDVNRFIDHVITHTKDLPVVHLEEKYSDECKNTKQLPPAT